MFNFRAFVVVIVVAACDSQQVSLSEHGQASDTVLVAVPNYDECSASYQYVLAAEETCADFKDNFETYLKQALSVKHPDTNLESIISMHSETAQFKAFGFQVQSVEWLVGMVDNELRVTARPTKVGDYADCNTAVDRMEKLLRGELSPGGRTPRMVEAFNDLRGDGPLGSKAICYSGGNAGARSVECRVTTENLPLK